MASDLELARIAAAMNALRPEWPCQSLLTHLRQHHATRPFQDLAVAAVAIAVDPTSSTPARLKESGPWWNLARAEATPGPPPIAEVLKDPVALGDAAAGAAMCREALRGGAA